jgi:hypothetical protein
MRYMSMHKATSSMEAGEPPSAAVMNGMGPLMGEMMQAAVFETAEGLQPSAKGVRLTFSGGKRTITPGPLAGANELIDRYMIVRVQSIEEAIDWGTRFSGGASEAEIDIRQVTEPWDLGMFPKPPDATATRFMILHKADSAAERGEQNAGHRLAEFAALTDAARSAGALVSGEILQPSSAALRLRFSGGSRSVIDGPFTETKELVAGFSIVRVNSRDEAIAWATRFAALVGDIEIDIRPLYEV